MTPDTFDDSIRHHYLRQDTFFTTFTPVSESPKESIGFCWILFTQGRKTTECLRKVVGSALRDKNDEFSFRLALTKLIMEKNNEHESFYKAKLCFNHNQFCLSE